MNLLTRTFITSPSRLFLFFEAVLLFIATPVGLVLYPARLYIRLSLWGITLYAALILTMSPGFSWRHAWNGCGWSRRDFLMATARFVVSTIGVYFLTRIYVPKYLFAFPTQRTHLWLLVMLLYPLLSALPQEMLFRVFFMRRYAPLIVREGLRAALSAFLFGLVHIVFRNPVSPILSWLCGAFLATSYSRHHSLKKAAIEHALYGDMVFSVGLGVYFITSSM